MEEIEEKKKGLLQQFEEERLSWKDKIAGISSRFKKIEDMVEVQVDLYSCRQIATEYVYQLVTTHSKFKKMYNAEWQKWYDHFTNNVDTRPSEKEKAKLIDDKTGDSKLRLEVIQTHIDYMRETVKTIDNMIFGVKHRLDIENFKRGNA